MSSALIVMAKRPRAGQTKTRLYPPLAPGDAAELYECFLRDVVATAASVPHVSRFVAHADPLDATYFDGIAPGFGHIPQGPGGLAERLDRVLRVALDEGFTAAIAVSSDSPQLPADHLSDAFGLLATGEADLVLGPCDDGGFYLLGATAPLPGFAGDVRLSTEHALADTVRVAQAAHRRVAMLPAAYDIDVWDDLVRLRSDLSTSTAAPHTRAWLDAADPRLFKRFCQG